MRQIGAIYKPNWKTVGEAFCICCIKLDFERPFFLQKWNWTWLSETKKKGEWEGEKDRERVCEWERGRYGDWLNQVGIFTTHSFWGHHTLAHTHMYSNKFLTEHRQARRKDRECVSFRQRENEKEKEREAGPVGPKFVTVYSYANVPWLTSMVLLNLELPL